MLYILLYCLYRWFINRSAPLFRAASAARNRGDEAVRELAAEQAAKGVKQLDRDDVDQGVKLLKTDALCFNDLLGGVPNEPFHLSTPLEPTLTVQAAWTLSLRMENNPFRRSCALRDGYGRLRIHCRPRCGRTHCCRRHDGHNLAIP